MKKLFSVLFVTALVLVSGCQKRTVVPTSEGTTVAQLSSTDNEVCYKGIKYVRFGYSAATWGGAKFDNEGRVSSCKVGKEPSANEVCYQGVVYVRFGYSEASWGGVRLTKDNKVISCGENVNYQKSMTKNNS
jgi:hypothetical protein